MEFYYVKENSKDTCQIEKLQFLQMSERPAGDLL